MSEQKTQNIDKEQLIPKITELKNSGHRLVQICGSKLDQFEIDYSFDKDYEFLNLKLILESTDAEIQSISHIYWNAFIYENELHDLFGIRVKDMAIDFKGNLYRTKVKWPFS